MQEKLYNIYDMRKRETFFLTFFLFFLVSLGIFALDKTGIFTGARGILEIITAPIQKGTQAVFRTPLRLFTNQELQMAKDENAKLLKILVDQKELQNENKALKDQFQTRYPKSANLLPAAIVGSPSFIPGVSLPSYFVLDKGEKEGIHVGQAVVINDTVVGKITRVSPHLSTITLVIDTSSSFAAVDSQSSALGVIKGQGSEIVLHNVLLSENLHINDSIVTKGDVDTNGLGYVPNLVVGKIISVDKKVSSLFQSAKVKSPIDFTKLTTVFVIVGSE